MERAGIGSMPTDSRTTPRQRAPIAVLARFMPYEESRSPSLRQRIAPAPTSTPRAGRRRSRRAYRPWNRGGPVSGWIMGERIEVPLGVRGSREGQVIRVVELRDRLVGEEHPPIRQPERVAVLLDEAVFLQVPDLPGNAWSSVIPVPARNRSFDAPPCFRGRVTAHLRSSSAVRTFPGLWAVSHPAERTHTGPGSPRIEIEAPLDIRPGGGTETDDVAQTVGVVRQVPGGVRDAPGEQPADVSSRPPWAATWYPSSFIT